jgi:hypothetical protein
MYYVQVCNSLGLGQLPLARGIQSHHMYPMYSLQSNMFIQELIKASVSNLGGIATYIHTIMHGTQNHLMNTLQFEPKPLDQTVYNILESN